MKRLVVINPNSSVKVTQSISESLDQLSSQDVQIQCLTNEKGPSGIESQRDADSVIPSVLEMIEAHSHKADAFVIACYSDPGLYSARESTSSPVFGIAQSAICFAASIGERVGVLSIRDAAVTRHMAYARSIQLDRVIVADLSVNLSVSELQNDELSVDQMIKFGRTLIEKYDANVIVLGCAGMSRHRSVLEQALNVPVVDPVQAAVGHAMTAIKCNYQTQSR